MQVAVGSAFRNAGGLIPRYFQQIDRLREQLGPSISVRVIAAEGDSRDRTRAMLQEKTHTTIVDTTHGGPHFGSTEQPERMRTLSRVGNAIFDAVQLEDEVLVYVESDLIWEASTIDLLIQMAKARFCEFDVVAPLIFAGDLFYDVWGFRGLDGQRFSPFEPYHSSMRKSGGSLTDSMTEVSSVGSCLVMRGEVARACRIRNDYCLVGWCEDARQQGYRIGVSANLKVKHPC